MMKSEACVLVFLVIGLSCAQPLCYTSCSKEGCTPTNSLACTRCDVGTILIGQRCASVGTQSQPIRILAPLSQNQLDTSTLPDYANRQQVQCSSASAGQSGVITYLNVTVTRNLVYTFRLPQVFIRSPHQYISIKFNAVIFNQVNNASMRVLVIDQADRRIYDNKVTPNVSNTRCNIGGTLQPSGGADYFSINLSSQTSQIFISISTLRPGDEVGVSNFEVYYGNCYMGCGTCEGPGQNQCLTCQNLLTFNPQTKSCDNCPSKFYKINDMCYPCPYNCAACQFNVSVGRPSCTQCEQAIAQGATPPACTLNIYVNQTLSSMKFNDSLGWKSTAILTNLTTTCGSYSLVGGLPSGLGGSTLSKTFTDLPVHNKIWLKFSLFMIDQITGSSYSALINVDGVRVLNYSTNIDASVMNTNECGTQRQQYIQTIMIPDIAHSELNATVQILGLGNYFGVRDFVVGVVNVTNISTCAQVNAQNQCIRCRNGFALVSPAGDNPAAQTPAPCTVCPDGYYNRSGFCRPCSIYCKTCTGNENNTRCSSCDEPLKFDDKTGTCNDQNNNLYTVALSQQWSNSTNDYWEFYPKLQSQGMDYCGNYSILGSTQIKYRSLQMKRTFVNLPNHQGVSLQFYFFQIDNYDGVTNTQNQYTVFFRLNGRVIPYTVARSGYNICGNSSYDSIQKVVLSDPQHSDGTLTVEINGNRTKFGISNLLLFLTNCNDCKDNGIGYQLQTIPLYSVETNPDPMEKGLKSKIVFDDRVQAKADPKNLFSVRLVNTSNLNASLLQQTIPTDSFAKGERDPYEIIAAYLHQNRQLRMFQNLIKDEYGKTAVGTLLQPDSIYGFISGEQNLVKSLRLQPVYGEFSRYDDIYSIIDTEQGNGPRYRANTRNLMNLFRGISILALFIGLISFFFGLSELFDDLFVLCQIIFVHIFINSSWVAATMKLPVGAMNLVQFMQWLPIQGREAIQRGIIPSNHYQRSPIVYEQYWKDITFARAIYHVVIFLAAMFVFYWLIKLVQSLRQPSINNVMQLTQKKYRYFENQYYGHTKRWFVFLDKVIRFTFFTVMWAACLQFIHFYNEPGGFMAWNSVLCIFMFVAYIVYVFISYFYLRKQAGISQQLTFKQKFDGIRIRRERKWYFIFKYMKWLAIAFIIGQLYKTNPLAALIPLMIIHLVDAAILLFLKPYILDSGQSQRIVSRCTKKYWTYYRISHIIQNLLFFILELVMIIMYGIRGYASKDSYLSTGYAACAFIIMLLVNGLIRLIWGFVRIFEVCFEDMKTKDQQIQSEDDIGPLKYLDFYRANANNDVFQTDRRNNRSPSIQIKVN